MGSPQYPYKALDDPRSGGMVPHGTVAGTMKKLQPEEKSWGTVVAERNRAKANQLTDSEREQLMARALQVIYGAVGRVPAKAHCR